MRQPVETGIFKATLSKAETKNDITNRVAREISDGLEAARIAKTARLRAAREAQEAKDGPASAVKPAKRKRKAK
ncbi:MAG: hypothetical protein KF810_23225 [Rhizobiaceae bacterium]|nr:hypothetical protein [Rhizobiaceae bacterium]